MLRPLTVLFLLCLSRPLCAENYVDKSFSDRLEFHFDKNDQTARTLFKTTKNIQQFLSFKFSRLPHNAPFVKLKIEGQAPAIDTFRVIYFKRQDLQVMNFLDIAHTIMSALVRRTLVGLGADSKVVPPEWLTAGLLHQFIVGETVSTQQRYPVTRLSVINQKYPALDQLIYEKAPSPENFWLYTIFAERSAIFYRGISTLPHGRNRLMQFLIRGEKSNIIDSFSIHYADFKNSRSTKKWFQSLCFRLCFNSINPYPPQKIEQRVNKLLSVNVARPGSKSFGTVRIPLEELTVENTEAVDRAYMTYLEGDLLELTFIASQTIRPALQSLVLSLRLFKKSQLTEFKESFKKSKQEFQRAIQHQIALNNYLDEVERKYNRSDTNYKKIIDVEELAAAKNRKLFPGFTRYLDELEQKLTNTVIE